MFKPFNSKNKTNWLLFLLVGYVMAAGCWWSYLLYIKNKDAWQAKISLLAKEKAEAGLVEWSELQQTAEYQEISSKYQRQEKMIMGEGLVLLSLMLVGLWRISKLHQQEESLKQQQQNFLLSITHELKTPLASIQLGLETVQKRQLNPEQLQQVCRRSLSETERLKSHIQAMLLAARVESGYKYSPQPMSLLDAAEEVAAAAQQKFKGEIMVETDQEEQAYTVLADSLTMQTAISNLVENAVKYAPDSPQILISLSSKNKEYSLSVADQGAGIPKQEKGKIFSKFYRIGDEQTRQKQGTGLGLYIVQKVIEAHKGSISVADNQPQGAIFTVHLPAYQQKTLLAES